MSSILTPYSSTQAPLGGFVSAGQAQQTASTQLLPDISSTLADASEELTQSLSSKVQEKTLKERKAETASPLVLLSRVQRLAMLNAMTGGSDQPAGEANQLAQALAKCALRQPGHVRRQAQQSGSDPSAQYLALLEAADLIDEGRVGPDPGGRAGDALRESASELLAAHGREIRADVNTFEATRILSPDEAANFRSTYRDVVLGESAVNDTLRRLLDMVPNGQSHDYLKALETTRQALGLDLAAARPSGDPVRLQTLMSDLSHLKVISTVIDHCQEISHTLSQRHGLPTFSATSMTSELLALTSERWVDGSRFSSICKRLKMDQPLQVAVHFMTGTRGAIREMPIQVFGSMEARQSLLDACQSALDEAIDREEGLI